MVRMSSSVQPGWSDTPTSLPPPPRRVRFISWRHACEFWVWRLAAAGAAIGGVVSIINSVPDLVAWRPIYGLVCVVPVYLILLGVFIFVLLLPYSDRSDVKGYHAVTGTITKKDVKDAEGRQLLVVTYCYPEPEDRPGTRTRTCISTKQQYASVEVGDAVTVLCAADSRCAELIYEWSRYRVDGAITTPPRNARD